MQKLPLPVQSATAFNSLISNPAVCYLPAVRESRRCFAISLPMGNEHFNAEYQTANSSISSNKYERRLPIGRLILYINPRDTTSWTDELANYSHNQPTINGRVNNSLVAVTWFASNMYLRIVAEGFSTTLPVTRRKSLKLSPPEPISGTHLQRALAVETTTLFQHSSSREPNSRLSVAGFIVASINLSQMVTISEQFEYLLANQLPKQPQRR